MSNEQTSEGFTGDGSPTNDRMSIKQIADNLSSWKSRIEKASPHAWDPIQTLIDRAAEIEKSLHTTKAMLFSERYGGGEKQKSAEDQNQTGSVFIGGFTPDKYITIPTNLFYTIAELAINNIGNAVSSSRSAGEALTAEGSALDLLEVVIELAKIGVASLNEK